MQQTLEDKKKKYKLQAQKVGVGVGAGVGAVGGAMFANINGHYLPYALAGATLLGGTVYLCCQKQFDKYAEARIQIFEAKERVRLYASIKANIEKIVRNSVNSALLEDNLDGLTLDELYQLEMLLNGVINGQSKTVNQELETTIFLNNISQKAKYIIELIKK